MTAVTIAGATWPAPAAAAQRSAGMEFVLGLGTAGSNILYGPAKVLYAVGGSVVGGLAWVFTAGRSDVARSIVQPAVRGDYAVVPENLTGEKPLTFVGRDPTREPYPYE